MIICHSRAGGNLPPSQWFPACTGKTALLIKVNTFLFFMLPIRVSTSLSFPRRRESTLINGFPLQKKDSLNYNLVPFLCHSREGGNPPPSQWFPACAGKTVVTQTSPAAYSPCSNYAW